MVKQHREELNRYTEQLKALQDEVDALRKAAVQLEEDKNGIILKKKQKIQQQ